MKHKDEEWLQELDSNEWLEFGQQYSDHVVKQDRDKAQKIFEKTFLNNNS